MRKLAHITCVCVPHIVSVKKNESRADLIWVSGLATGGFEDAGRGFELASSDVCPPPSGGETYPALGDRMCSSKNQKVSYFTYYIYPLKRKKKCKSMNYQLLCDPVNSFLCQFHPP